MQTWLLQNLQKWTPFSVLAIMVVAACLFIVTWDSINNIPIPSFFYVLLTLVTGGTGTIAAISHGVVVANGVAKDTAKAVVSETAKQGGFDSINSTTEVPTK